MYSDGASKSLTIDKQEDIQNNIARVEIFFVTQEKGILP